MGQVEACALVAAAVFGVNLLPAFGPPTWAVLVLLSLHTDLSSPVLVVVGALSAAAGRLLLARGTRLFSDRLSDRTRTNLEAASELVTRRRGRAVAALALFALSPVPSAQLFEAAGLMKVRLVPLTAAFFTGRLVSYSLYVGSASALSRTGTGQVLLSNVTSPWAVVVEIAMLAALVLLARVDWARFVHPDRDVSGPP
jgi:membrane protein YqaA with SNARE-associated domain